MKNILSCKYGVAKRSYGSMEEQARKDNVSSVHFVD